LSENNLAAKLIWQPTISQHGPQKKPPVRQNIGFLMKADQINFKTGLSTETSSLWSK